VSLPCVGRRYDNLERGAIDLWLWGLISCDLILGCEPAGWMAGTVIGFNDGPGGPGISA